MAVPHPVEADQLLGRAVEAVLESVDLAEPAVELGFLDAVTEVGDDLDQSRPGLGVQAQARAADAGFSELNC